MRRSENMLLILGTMVGIEMHKADTDWTGTNEATIVTIAGTEKQVKPDAPKGLCRGGDLGRSVGGRKCWRCRG